MNDCECHLVIRGDAAQRQKLLVDCAGLDQLGDKVTLDFEKIIPSPSYLQANHELLADWRQMHWEVPYAPGGWENYVASDDEETPDLTRIVLVCKDYPPLPVIAKLAESYAALDFDLTYFESGLHLAGRAAWSRGQLTEEQVSDKQPEKIVSFLDEHSPSLSEAARHVYRRSE